MAGVMSMPSASRTTCANPFTSAVASAAHAFPPSVVLKTYVFMSPVRWPSKVAYAMFSSAFDASTPETQVRLGSPGTLATTFVQFLPPSRVTCRLPSSVPTQTTFGFFGDSLMVMMVV